MREKIGKGQLIPHGLISLKAGGCSDYGDYRANERS